MNNQKPFFSILIPSYNRPEYIKRCLDSIINNDFNDYEIIISDDKSPRADEVEEKINPFLKYENIRFFKQEENLKEPGSKNYLVSKAKGLYNIILGDDDKLYPGSLTTLKQYIDKYPGYDLYSFGYTVIDESDKYYYSRHAPIKMEVSLEEPYLVEQLFISDIFPFWLYHPSTFCCRNGVEKNIQYSNNAGIGEDYLFLFDLINNRKKMLIIPESLFFWRKIQAEGKVEQTNQSLGDFCNVQARKNILYHLQDRKDLNRIIFDFISGFEYRKKFLYNSIISDKNTNRDSLIELGLNADHLNEYKNYSINASYFEIHYKPYLIRSINFIKLFGLRGLYCLVKISLARIIYYMKTLYHQNIF